MILQIFVSLPGQWFPGGGPVLFPGLFRLGALDTLTYQRRYIATSHVSLTRNGGLVREVPLFQGNLG